MTRNDDGVINVTLLYNNFIHLSDGFSLSASMINTAPLGGGKYAYGDILPGITFMGVFTDDSDTDFV